MSDQSNLPELRKYGKIKEVIIKKGINVDIHKNQFEYYQISFIEIIEKELEQKGLFKTKKVIVPEEVKRTVPFSFKSLEDAKDFAQYLPNMSITGRRLFETFDERSHEKCDILYETYQITTESINSNIYIKFTENCEHKRKINRFVII